MSDVPRLHIELPDDLHRRAKIAAVERDETLKALVIEALELLIAKHEEERHDQQH